MQVAIDKYSVHVVAPPRGNTTGAVQAYRLCQMAAPSMATATDFAGHSIHIAVTKPGIGRDLGNDFVVHSGKILRPTGFGECLAH